MSKLVAFDIGTSGLKAVLYDRERGIVGTSRADYGPEPAPHRQHSDVWWNAARDAMQRLAPDDIEAVVLSGTMENLIIRDHEGAPLHSVLLYSNPCGSEYFEMMKPDLVNARRIIGNEPEPLMTGFKWRWFCDVAPTIVPRVRMVMAGSKDDLLYRMTGRAVTDAVTASTTGFMDISRRDWSEDMLSLFGIKRDMLPEILEAGALVGALKPEAARHLGLNSGIPVMNGCGDVGASMIGSFCDHPDDMSVHLGQSGWIARTIPIAQLDDSRPAYRLAHPYRELMIEISSMRSTGSALSWAEKLFGVTLDAVESELLRADIAPPNLIFLPYLSGEHSLFDDEDIRGAFLGLDVKHNSADLLYSVLEGVGFATSANLKAFAGSGQDRITMIGEGAKLRIWAQMLADSLGRPINRVANPTLTPALGVCRIATSVLGWPSPETFKLDQVNPRADRVVRSELLGDAFERATGIARAFSPFLTV